VEEKAMLNLAAQEFDSMKMLMSLPKDSEVYRHKMNIYME
jgi:hypothetical protein